MVLTGFADYCVIKGKIQNKHKHKQKILSALTTEKKKMVYKKRKKDDQNTK